MIYRVSPIIEKEKMNTWSKEDKDTTLSCFSKFRNVKNYIRTCITNQCLRFKNWKFNSTLKSKGGNLDEFQEKSKKKEIVVKLNELVQLLKDEKVKTK